VDYIIPLITKLLSDEMEEIKTARNIEFNFSLVLSDLPFGSGK